MQKNALITSTADETTKLFDCDDINFTYLLAVYRSVSCSPNWMYQISRNWYYCCYRLHIHQRANSQAYTPLHVTHMKELAIWQSISSKRRTTKNRRFTTEMRHSLLNIVDNKNNNMMIADMMINSKPNLSTTVNCKSKISLPQQEWQKNQKN